VASDADDIPLLTHRLSEGMLRSSSAQQCAGNSVAFAQTKCARCFLFLIASVVVVIYVCFLLFTIQ